MNETKYEVLWNLNRVPPVASLIQMKLLPRFINSWSPKYVVHILNESKMSFYEIFAADLTRVIYRNEQTCHTIVQDSNSNSSTIYQGFCWNCQFWAILEYKKCTCIIIYYISCIFTTFIFEIIFSYIYVLRYYFIWNSLEIQLIANNCERYVYVRKIIHFLIT